MPGNSPYPWCSTLAQQGRTVQDTLSCDTQPYPPDMRTDGTHPAATVLQTSHKTQRVIQYFFFVKKNIDIPQR